MNISVCRKWLGLSALLAATAMAIMLYMALTAKHVRTEHSFSAPLLKVALQGHVRIGQGLWQAYPPPNSHWWRNVGQHSVEFSGHTLTDIPQGRTVFVHVLHVRATLAVNGTPLLTIGEEGSTPAFTHTPGHIWASFTSPGISPTDTLTITVQATAGNMQPTQIEAFLDNIHSGSVWELLHKELQEVWWAIPLVGIYISMSILLAILALLFLWRKEAKLALQAALLTGIYFSAGFWSLINYSLLSLILPYPMLIIAWETISFICAMAFIVLYVSTLLTGVRHSLALCTATLLFLVLSGCIALQLMGGAELFVLQNYLHVLGLCAVMACVCFAFLERKVAEQESIRSFMAFIPLCLLSCLDILFNMLGTLTNGLFASCGFLITSAAQFFLLVDATSRKIQQASKLEREVVESRIATSLSQIRPHFLYNVLTSIQYLCAEKPAKTEQAITDFIAFLRGNLDSLSHAAPIALAQELEHVRHYLALEHLRYEHKLRVKWNLEEVDILVPALSVQPLVENAVRWGMREDGLTLRITTRTTEDSCIITVEDDGTGFDPQAQHAARGNGIGLDNIRTRVCSLHGSSLHVDSTLGKGTTVTLIFPLRMLRRHP